MKRGCRDGVELRLAGWLACKIAERDAADALTIARARTARVLGGDVVPVRRASGGRMPKQPSGPLVIQMDPPPPQVIVVRAPRTA